MSAGLIQPPCKRILWRPLALSGLLLLCLALQTAPADATDVYLLVEPDAENNKSRRDANTIGSMLHSELGAQLSQVLHYYGSEDLRDTTAESVVRDLDITHYSHVKVLSDDTGIHLNVALKTPQHELTKPLVFGAADAQDLGKINAGLRVVAVVFQAMLEGFSPSELIGVDCFTHSDTPFVRSISRTLSMGLASEIGNTQLRATFWAQGLASNECFSTTEVKKFFSYVIDGFVQEASSAGAPAPGTVLTVTLSVWVFQPAGVHNLLLPTVDGGQVTQQLAERVATCWDRWDQAGC